MLSTIGWAIAKNEQGDINKEDEIAGVNNMDDLEADALEKADPCLVKAKKVL